MQFCPFNPKAKIISGLSMAFYGFLWLFDGRINGKMTELTKIAGLSYDQNDRTRLLTRTVSDNTISPMFINQEAGIFQSAL
jgi:hypothetical protein